MKDNLRPALVPPPDWSRHGLPPWTYHSDEHFDLERREVFLGRWQLVCHVSDVPAPGDWFAVDLMGERAIVMRDTDGRVLAFHNVCRHRGARVLDGASGHCRGSIVCPFHGWVYGLDGQLRGPARPETFGAMDRARFGLKPVETEIWMGFVFLRFLPGQQGTVADWLAPYGADFSAYRAEELVPVGGPYWSSELPVNWKSVRDVDNEGYHVAMAHPALQDLYGRTYFDSFPGHELALSIGTFGDQPGRRWSVKAYVKLSRSPDWFPERLKNAWTYYGLFPNSVIAFTPESAQFYQEIPISPGRTLITGRLYRFADEDRTARAARYLAQRIDRETSQEDQQLSIWSNESMKSSAFDGFHLSDLEYGVYLHHEMLRSILPVMRQNEPPPAGTLRQRNEFLLQSTDDFGSECPGDMRADDPGGNAP